MKIYLAIPYSQAPQESFKVANETAGKLMELGHIVFSPISHSHPIVLPKRLKFSWEFWKKQDFPYIEWCDELWVADFGDWETSTGVCAEIEEARRLKKNVRFL